MCQSTTTIIYFVVCSLCMLLNTLVCCCRSCSLCPLSCLYIIGKWTKWVYPPLFQTKVGGGKMQTSSPPVITRNRSQSNPDDMITLPRPIQSVGMDLYDVSGTSTGQTLPRERRAPPGTHFCPTIWWVYPHSATIFILHPLLSTFSSTFVRNIKQQLQESCARVRRIQTPGVVTICGWSAAGRRPTPGLQQ